MSWFDIDTQGIAGLLLVRFEDWILIYFLVLNSFYALLLILSIPELWSHWHLSEDDYRKRLLGTDVLPPITLMVPAYNEEASIVASVMSFLTLEYPRHEVVLVNDGSSDGTMDALIAAYDLYLVPPAFAREIDTEPVHAYYRSRAYSKLVVIDKANGGKGDALNAALNAARFPYVVAVDADTLIEPDALLRLARPFLLSGEIAAVGGTIRVANACAIAYGRVTMAKVDSRPLPGIQTVEYLRAFLFGRLGWNRLGGNLIISGAFGLFKREYMLAIGGYRNSSETEDMDLVVRLHRYLHDNKIRAAMPFIPDPVAWTEVPTSVRVLSRQRERWHRGLIETIVTHRGMLFNPRYGRVGLVSFPFYVFGEMFAPLIETAGYIGLIVGVCFGVVDTQLALLLLVVAVGYGLLLSLWSVVLEEATFRRYPRRGDFTKLLFFAFLEPFGYRQLTVWFRVKAFWSYARGVRHWGDMQREGFAGVSEGNAAATPTATAPLAAG